MSGGVQAVVGMIIVMLGCLHFADRYRANEARRQFYVGTPTSVARRSALALVEIVIGFALLFTA